MSPVTQSSTPVFVGIGEILWDLFPSGRRFGGAPANFACHAAALGCRAAMISAVGQEELGDLAVASLAEHRVDTSLVTQLADLPTGMVRIAIDQDGVATYQFGENEAWDHLAWGDQLGRLAAQTDCVCFGTLSQRSNSSRETIQRFVAEVPDQALRVFDINLRPPPVEEDVIVRSLELANVLKLNHEELPFLASLFGMEGNEVEQMQGLARRFELQLVALTRGADGAILVSGEEVSENPGMEVEVQDTVGAGDAFTAAMALGWLRGEELDAINRFAVRIAGYVCSQSGATPVLPDKILDQA